MVDASINIIELKQNMQYIAKTYVKKLINKLYSIYIYIFLYL